MHLGENLEFFPNFSAAQIKFMSSEPSTSKTISDDEKLELLYAKPVIDGKNFYNPPSFKNWTGLPGLKSFFKWKLLETDNSNVPKNEEKLEQSLPISNLTNFSSKTPNSSLFATWLGHSTVLVQLDGLCFITDPIWAERASFLSFVGPKRYRPPPMKIKDLPELDVGVISHDHYDHLDISAVKRITSKNPSMRWFVPLKIKELLESNGIQNDLSNPSRITEMTWGQEVVISKKDTKFSVWCLPAQHWGQRGPFDRYKRLWSGWAIVGPTRRFYYSGDTGNCEEEFEKIGNHLGPFDLAAIPIGAYEPNWFMKSQHINPEEAVGVHQLIKSKISIGVHWGTYPMGSYEHYLEPRDKLAEIMSTRRDLNHTKFITIDQGTIWDEANFKNA